MHVFSPQVLNATTVSVWASMLLQWCSPQMHHEVLHCRILITEVIESSNFFELQSWNLKIPPTLQGFPTLQAHLHLITRHPSQMLFLSKMCEITDLDFCFSKHKWMQEIWCGLSLLCSKSEPDNKTSWAAAFVYLTKCCNGWWQEILQFIILQRYEV